MVLATALIVAALMALNVFPAVADPNCQKGNPNCATTTSTGFSTVFGTTTIVTVGEDLSTSTLTTSFPLSQRTIVSTNTTFEPGSAKQRATTTAPTTV
jgi:hypothetical protein